MNLFLALFLATKDASWHADKWVPKLALEAAQLLYNAHYEHAAPWTDSEKAANLLPNKLPPLTASGKIGYKPTHRGMAIAKWVVHHANAYNTVVEYALAVMDEYEIRHPGKDSILKKHLNWLAKNVPADMPCHETDLLPMPCHVRVGSVVIPNTWDDTYDLQDAYMRTVKRDFLLALVEKRNPPGLLEWLSVDDATPAQIAEERGLRVLNPKDSKTFSYANTKRKREGPALSRPPPRKRAKLLCTK